MKKIVYLAIKVHVAYIKYIKEKYIAQDNIKIL